MADGELALLVVGHEATRTGSPLVLLGILRELAKIPGWTVDLALARGGPLVPEFEAVTRSVRVVDVGRLRARAELAVSLARHVGLQRAVHRLSVRAVARRLVRTRGYDVVYVNSTPALAAVRADDPAVPVLFHSHELRYARTQSLSDDEQSLVRSMPRWWVAASKAVRDDLVTNVGVPENAVTVVHEFPAATPRRVSESERAATREALRIPPDVDVILGCGSADYRKGPDLFVQTAVAFRRLFPDQDCRWVWVGDAPTAHENFRLLEDIARSHSEDYIRKVGTVEDIQPYLAVATILCLSSREDPYPLVMLEAAANRMPIAAFGESGGASDLAEHGAALLAAPLDVVDMAQTVNRLLSDRGLRAAVGEAGRTYVDTEHSSAIAARQVESVIRRLAGRSDR